MKLVLEQGLGKVVLDMSYDGSHYRGGGVYYNNRDYLIINYTIHGKSIMSSTHLSEFDESVHIVNLMQELMSVWDTQPSIDVLKSLGYKEVL